MSKMTDNWYTYSQEYFEQFCSMLNQKEKELIEEIFNKIRNPYLSRIIDGPQEEYYKYKINFSKYSLKSKEKFENYFLDILKQYDKETCQKLGHILVLLPNIKGLSKKKRLDRDKGEFELIILSLLELLLRNGYIDPNYKLSNGSNFIQTALLGYLNYDKQDNGDRLFKPHSEKFVPALIDMALKYGLDVNSKDNEGNTIIHTMIVSIVTYRASDITFEYTSLANMILTSLKLISRQFNFYSSNNDDQNIIDLMDYCIKSTNPLTANAANMSHFTLGWDKHYEENWKHGLNFYGPHIAGYIREITNSNAACCISKNELSKVYTEQITKINRLEIFLNLPLTKEKSITTTEELRHIIDKQYIYYDFLVKRVKETIILIPELIPYVEVIFTFIEKGQVAPVTLTIFNCLSFKDFNDWDSLMINHQLKTPPKMLTMEYLKEFTHAFEYYYIKNSLQNSLQNILKRSNRV